MAEVELTVTKFGETVQWVQANADGHAYVNDGLTIFMVDNTSGGAYTAQHNEQRQCDFGHATVNDTDPCPDGGITRVFRAQNIVRFNDSAGKTHIEFTTSVPGDATLRVAAVSYTS